MSRHYHWDLQSYDEMPVSQISFWYEALCSQLDVETKAQNEAIESTQNKRPY